MVMFVAGSVGGGFFDRKIVTFIPLLADIAPDYLEIRDVIMVFVIINSSVFGFALLLKIIAAKESFGGVLMAIYDMGPIFIILASVYLIDDDDEFTHKNAGVIIMAISIIFTLVTTKVIISTMAKMKLSVVNLEVFLMGGFFVIQYLYKGKDRYLTQKYRFIVTFILVLVLYLKFVRTCIMQITNHLGIFCFSIKKPKKNNKTE